MSTPSSSDRWNIAGKTVVLTGGTTGIGRATVEELARRGARVIFTARRSADGDRVLQEVGDAVPDAEMSHHEVHLDDLASVREFAADLRREMSSLDVLVNNAGVSLTERRLTIDGFESMFGINHLGHFLLTSELVGLLTDSGRGRVVIVASDAHRMGGPLDFTDLQGERARFGAVGGMRVYGRSKLANILHSRELARRLHGTGVTVNCLHPGFVRTRLARDSEATPLGERFIWPLASKFAMSPREGARTSVYAICSPEMDGRTGQYLVKEKVARPNRLALDDQSAARLWDASSDLVGVSS